MWNLVPEGGSLGKSEKQQSHCSDITCGSSPVFEDEKQQNIHGMLWTEGLMINSDLREIFSVGSRLFLVGDLSRFKYCQYTVCVVLHRQSQCVTSYPTSSHSALFVMLQWHPVHTAGRSWLVGDFTWLKPPAQTEESWKFAPPSPVISVCLEGSRGEELVQFKVCVWKLYLKWALIKVQILISSVSIKLHREK